MKDCELCGGPYPSALHVCPQDKPTMRNIQMRCRCGRSVLLADPTKPRCNACLKICGQCECPDWPQTAHSAESGGFTPGAGTDSQPMPRQDGGEPVTPAARTTFLAMLDQRERKGIETYGRSLHTQNGRDAVQDGLEELIDAWQYLVQVRMERAALERALAEARAEVERLREREATLLRHLKRYHPPGECDILRGLDPLPVPEDW